MKLIKSSSPHIRGNVKIDKIMLDVFLALLPALAAGVVVLGVRAALVTAVCVIFSVGGELIYSFAAKRKNTVKDFSAVVTGMLLSMTLPHTIPLWQAAVGSIFSVFFIKCLCGGIGQNVFNPALLGRAFMMLIYPLGITRYEGLDGISSATPLHHMVIPALPDISIFDMFLGKCPGSIGEISALALLLGGGYLIWRRVISFRIPLSYLGAVALLTLTFHKTQSPISWMLYSLFSGGLMLGAFFMATDYSSSPVTPKGQVIYGIGCGIFTVIFRYYGLFPEGVTYAILLMNAVTWTIDKFTPPRRFGAKGKVIP